MWSLQSSSKFEVSSYEYVFKTWNVKTACYWVTKLLFICSQQHTFAWAGLDHTRPGTVLCDLLSDGMSQHLALELEIVCNGPNGNSTGMFAVPVTAESMSQHGKSRWYMRATKIYCSSTCRFKWCNQTYLQLNAVTDSRSCFPTRAHCWTAPSIVTEDYSGWNPSKSAGVEARVILASLRFLNLSGIYNNIEKVAVLYF